MPLPLPLAAGLTVPAYAGPPEPHGTSAVTAWTFQPAMAVVVVALGLAYAAGVRRCRAGGEPWARWRGAMFGSGLAVTVIATMGWPGRYAHVLLSAFATQALLLLLLAPALLATGAPLGLAARALPPPWGARVSAVVAGPVSKVVLSPAVAPVTIPLATGGLFFTPLLGIALRHASVLFAVQVALLVLGFVFSLPLAGEDGGTSSLTIGLGVFLGLLELLLDAIPGFVLRSKTHLLSTGMWPGLARPWGASPLRDQQLAGDVLWIVAEVLDIPFLAVMLYRWTKADEKEQARVDSALDARSEKPRAAQVLEPELDVPWWEKDQRMFDPARAARYRADARRNRPDR
ncbi:MAG TPA: cytochrome c oxidase assembly protein [Mycobacteriales bacterium]|nr:cytochrome c oxidase assembly protein [Mycobacteriales bacterium]